MGAMEELAAALAGQQAQQLIAKENPYYSFSDIPDSIGQVIMSQAGKGNYDTKDLITSALVTGLVGGTLKGFGDDYQNTLTERYQGALSDYAQGVGKADNTYNLSPSLFRTAKDQGSLFKLQNDLQMLQGERDYQRERAGKIQDTLISKGYILSPDGEMQQLFNPAELKAQEEKAIKKAQLEAESEFYRSSPLSNPNSPQNKATVSILADIAGRPETKEYSEAKGIFDTMTSSYDKDTRAADLAYVYGLPKMLDPSVVKEGEQRMLLAQIPGLQRFMADIEGVYSGKGKLTADARKAILEIAKDKLDSQGSRYNRAISPYQKLIEAQGLNLEQSLPFPLYNADEATPSMLKKAYESYVKGDSGPLASPNRSGASGNGGTPLRPKASDLVAQGYVKTPSRMGKEKMVDIIPLDQVEDDIGTGPMTGGLPNFIPLDQVEDDITPSLFKDPIKALTSADWWLTRPSGERISAAQAVAGPTLSALDSMTFGSGDEIAAAGASLFNNGNYEDHLNNARAVQQSFHQASPVIDTAIGISGALKLPIGSSLKASDGALKTTAKLGTKASDGALKTTAKLGTKASDGALKTIKPIDGALKTIAKLGTEGAAYGAAYGFGEGEGGFENRLEKAKNDAIASGLVSGGLGAVGAGAKLLPSAKEAARKLELSAFGANKTRIGKAFQNSPEVLDELGNKLNPISEAISSFRKDGGGSQGMSGASLLEELSSQSSKYKLKLAEELSEASRLQKDAIIPEFSYTQKYINNLPGAVKKEGQRIAEKLIKNTTNNTDGTLKSLQKEKLGLAPLIKDTTYGNNANPLKANILKHIKADLRRTIEDGYQTITGKSKTNISRLNQEIGKRELLEPLFENMRNTGEARDVFDFLIENWKTTGGFGAAALLTGNYMLPILGGLAVTPKGRAIASDFIKKTPSIPLDKINNPRAIGLMSSIFKTPNSSSSDINYSLATQGSSQDSRQLLLKNTQPPTLTIQGQRTPQNSIEETQLQEKKQVSSPNSAPIPTTKQDEIDLAFNSLISGMNNKQIAPEMFDFEDKTKEIFDRLARSNMDAKQVQIPDTDVSPDSDFQRLAKAVTWQESRGKADAVSPKGATGLMQIMPATAKDIASELGIEEYDLKDPEINKMFGEYYLQKMLDTFDGDEELALAAYNAGPNRIKKLLKQVKGSKFADIKHLLPKETRDYVPSVQKKFKTIEV